MKNESKSNIKVTSIRVPLDLWELIADRAEKENRSLHNMILTILRDSLEAKQE